MTEVAGLPGMAGQPSDPPRRAEGRRESGSGLCNDAPVSLFHVEANLVVEPPDCARAHARPGVCRLSGFPGGLRL
jgi:hypothetical protein